MARSGAQNKSHKQPHRSAGTTNEPLGYTGYRRPELHKLVVARTKNEVPKNRSRLFYINLLEEYHRSQTSRAHFLGLPAEMRNLIYVELLTLRTSRISVSGDQTPKNACYPEILRVNKQIYKEAEAILYDENVADVNLSGHYRGMGSQNASRDLQTALLRTASVQSQTISSGRVAQGPLIQYGRVVPQLPRPHKWPSYLLKFRSVAINVDYGQDVRSWRPYYGQSIPGSISTHTTKILDVAMSRDVYDLFAFLKASRHMEKVTFSISHKNVTRQRRDSEFTRLEILLWPLRTLRHLKELSITGLPAEIITRLKTSTSATVEFKSDLLLQAYHFLEKDNARNSTGGYKSQLSELSSIEDERLLLDLIRGLRNSLHPRRNFSCERHALISTLIKGLNALPWKPDEALEGVVLA